MELLKTLDWINIIIVVGVFIGIVIIWFVWNKQVNAVYFLTKSWIKRNPNRIKDLVNESSSTASVWSERSKWLYRQVLGIVRGDHIQLLNEQEANLRNENLSLDNLISQLVSSYADKVSVAQNQIELSRDKIIEGLKARIVSLRNMNERNKESIKGLESKHKEEAHKLAQSQKQKKASWVEVALNKLIEHKKRVRTNLKSSIQSIISLWLVYLLLIIDAYFMHEAIEPLFVYNAVWGWIISFSAVALFLALFELLYILIFTKKQAGTVIYRILQVFFLTPIVASTGWALWQLRNVRETDPGTAEMAIKQFGLYMLPLAVFLVAKLIHDYNRNPNNKRDALVIILETIINQSLILFWLIIRFIFPSKLQKTNLAMRRLQIRIKDEKRAIDKNLREVKSIETTKIPNAEKEKERAIEDMRAEFQRKQDEDRAKLIDAKEKNNKVINKLRETKGSIQRQCYLACVRFIKIDSV